MKFEIWDQECFVGLCFPDLNNETFSHCHNKLSTIFDCERFFKNVKNGMIVFFKTLLIHWNTFKFVDGANTQAHDRKSAANDPRPQTIPRLEMIP